MEFKAGGPMTCSSCRHLDRSRPLPDGFPRKFYCPVATERGKRQLMDWAKGLVAYMDEDSTCDKWEGHDTTR